MSLDLLVLFLGRLVAVVAFLWDYMHSESIAMELKYGEGNFDLKKFQGNS